jgi:hypothetical protein
MLQEYDFKKSGKRDIKQDRTVVQIKKKNQVSEAGKKFKSLIEISIDAM